MKSEGNFLDAGAGKMRGLLVQAFLQPLILPAVARQGDDLLKLDSNWIF